MNSDEAAVDETASNLTAENAVAKNNPTAPVLGVPRSEHVQSLERGLAVILAFANGHQHLTIAEVARAIGLSRGTSRRFLVTLHSLGYLECTDKRYSLLPSILDLGYRFFAARSWWPEAQKIAQRVATISASPCAIAVLKELSAVYVCYAAAEQSALFKRTVGTRLPAHASAVGRALLAGLDRDDLARCLRSAELPALTPKTITSVKMLTTVIAQVRAQGYAYVSEELELGLASLSVPVLNRCGDVVAAMSISFRPNQVWQEHPSEHPALQAMREASRNISRLLPS
jgi:IclR family transcriptional regulator, pca regulon regulatory protein